jgi:predicted nuclease of restriction endonuclease-like (RecB) superfamily
MQWEWECWRGCGCGRDVRSVSRTDGPRKEKMTIGVSGGRSFRFLGRRRCHVSDPHSAPEQQLYERVAGILDEARSRVARTINTAMVHAYWNIGREIVEVEQQGAGRAEYGERLIEGLARRLSKRFGRGMGVATLRRARRFYIAYPTGSAIRQAMGDLEIRSTVLTESGTAPVRGTALTGARGKGVTGFPPILGWSHYLVLLRIQNDHARAFYEIEAAREGWSVRELERQVGALVFERLTINRDPDQRRTLARDGQDVAVPSDVLKDPFVLEFLDLKEVTNVRERGLEQAIIDRLEGFLLEMGKGFCFVARQKRLTLEGDHFYVDLVFYNRLLRCFVLVDLKLGMLSHRDLGQMQMYVNFFDRFQRVDHEARTIGIVLCSDKNDAMVKITLPEDNQQILAARYQMYLPTEGELRAELEKGREEGERALRLES